MFSLDRWIFEPFDLVQVVMVELVQQWIERLLDFVEINDPTRVGVYSVLDGDAARDLIEDDRNDRASARTCGPRGPWAAGVCGRFCKKEKAKIMCTLFGSMTAFRVQRPWEAKTASPLRTILHGLVFSAMSENDVENARKRIDSEVAIPIMRRSLR